MAIHLPVALQLYSVRDQAADDLYNTMKQVAAWGFDGVEFAGYHGHAAQTIKDWLDELGLKCPSAHLSFDALEDGQLDETIAFHKTIGCNTLLVGWLDENLRNTLTACTQTAEKFARRIDKLRTHGMRTGFHAHGADVIALDPPAGDGRSPWDLFAALTPDDFILQYDTANAMEGGANPVKPIKSNPGRSVLLHLKEYGDGTGTLAGHDGHAKAVIGQGDVPFKEVLDAATSVGGTQWLIVEQEGHPTLPPMDAAKQCFDNLKTMMA